MSNLQTEPLNETSARSLTTAYIASKKMQATIQSVKPVFFSRGYCFVATLQQDGKPPKKYYVLRSGIVIPSAW